jgi:hypothetical protein
MTQVTWRLRALGLEGNHRSDLTFSSTDKNNFLGFAEARVIADSAPIPFSLGPVMTTD